MEVVAAVEAGVAGSNHRCTLGSWKFHDPDIAVAVAAVVAAAVAAVIAAAAAAAVALHRRIDAAAYRESYESTCAASYYPTHQNTFFCI